MAMNQREIFNAALDIDDHVERAEFLDRNCGDDAALRKRIDAIIAVQGKLDSFLAEPAGQAAALVNVERPGHQIGPYILKEQIGEGGFGLVFEAEQHEPVRRLVALKVIKPGMDSREVLARFAVERQALALMDHPNIAKVFDAGTTPTGRPYFVMELVRGNPITDYCDHNQLPPRERLELFISVCQAVQHAHHKGVIHRDLKPSNILVAKHDDWATVKVIDFGVAKAIGRHLTEQSIQTRMTQLVGTPLYMSPEQAHMSGQDIDTRSDIYSLGVLLYELLTGTTPFDKDRFSKAAFDEIRRIIREEEPQKPSTRVSSIDSLPSVAAVRKTEPARLSKLIRGDLDWITMRCLEKNRGRRYETANGLARDIERFLADEPVEAGPPSARYRFKKFIDRNQGPVIAASLVLFSLVVGIIGTTSGLIWAVRERNDKELARRDAQTQATEAQQQAANAEAINDFLLRDLLGQADLANQLAGPEGREPDIKVRTLLDRAAHEIEGRFANQPLTEAAIRMTLADTYWALGSYAEAQPHVDRCIAIRQSILGPDHIDTLRAMLRLAVLCNDRGRHDEAEKIGQDILESTSENELIAEVKTSLAVAAVAKRQYERAESLYQDVVTFLRVRFGENHGRTQYAKYCLAIVVLYRNQHDRAVKMFQEVTAWNDANLGRDHPHTIKSRHGWAGALSASGKYDQAEQIFRELLTITERLRPDHPNTLNIKSGHAMNLFRQEKYALAEPIYEDVLQVQVKKLGPKHPLTIGTTNNLALVYDRQGNSDRAVPLYMRAVEATREQFGLAHPDTQNNVRNLIACYESIGKHELAAPLCRELIDYWQAQTARPAVQHNFAPLYVVGRKLWNEDKHAEAELVLRAALAMAEKLDPDSVMRYRIQIYLGSSIIEQGRNADAEPLLLAVHDDLKKRAPGIPVETAVGLQDFAIRCLCRLYEHWENPAELAKWKSELATLHRTSKSP